MATLSLTDHAANSEIVSTTHNANNAILESWSTSVSDDNFASTAGMYTAYRTILESSALANDSVHGASGTYLMGYSDTATSAKGGLFLSATNSNATSNATIPHSLYFDDADYAVSGRTARLRVRAQAFTNATASAITLTAGLHQITGCAGTADNIQFTAGAAVSGSTVAFASQTASTLGNGTSGDFAIPADGHYCLCVVLSAAMTADSVVAINTQLQVHWV